MELIVIAAPRASDKYYRQTFSRILGYDIHFAEQAMKNDKIIILAHRETIPDLEQRLPKEIIVQANILDIWIRDFAPVLPSKQIKFRYKPDYLEEKEAIGIEKSFVDFAKSINLEYLEATNLILDGGNVVDNGVDKIILSDRVLSENSHYTQTEIISRLKDLLGVKEIAIIPQEEGDTTGYADEMVVFISEDQLLVNTYPEPFQSKLLASLKKSLTNVEIIEIPYIPPPAIGKGFASTCGVYVNSIITESSIYLPIFGWASDDRVIKLLQSHTNKEIIPINASTVCFMGGSLRCLSWQIKGDNAEKLLKLTHQVNKETVTRKEKASII